MAKQIKKSKAEIPTIDCDLVTIQTPDGNEFGFDTANKIEVNPQIETTDAVKLVVKGILRAQKPSESTITGHEITLTDNVFNPELVLIMQGGQIKYDAVDTDLIVGYQPPVTGSGDRGQVFTLNAYSASYDASGQISRYEKISYPNCTGVPIAFGSEDGSFRAPEYKINSAPNSDEPPYDITYVNELPTLVDEYLLSTLTVTSEAGTDIGSTKITVLPIKEVYTNKYYYKTDPSTITLPLYGAAVTGYTLWDGVVDIIAASDSKIAIVETDANDKSLAGGMTTIVSKA